LNVSLADSTLGGDPAFAAQLSGLYQTYQPVVTFVNQSRAARGAPPLDVVAVAATWAGRTADELLAYTIDEQVHIAVQFAQQRTPRGGGMVAMVPPFDPAQFFRLYASRHWLTDPADRTALQSPAADAVLSAVGRNPAMRAVYRAVQRWVQEPHTP